MGPFPGCLEELVRGGGLQSQDPTPCHSASTSKAACILALPPPPPQAASPQLSWLLPASTHLRVCSVPIQMVLGVFLVFLGSPSKEKSGTCGRWRLASHNPHLTLTVPPELAQHRIRIVHPWAQRVLKNLLVQVPCSERSLMPWPGHCRYFTFLNPLSSLVK